MCGEVERGEARTLWNEGRKVGSEQKKAMTEGTATDPGWEGLSNLGTVVGRSRVAAAFSLR